MKLTAIQCKNALSNPEKDYNMADGEGLFLKVKKNGTKQWRLAYRRPKDGKTDTLIIGKYPQISLSNARAKKSEARALLAQNINPKEQHKPTKTQTFLDVACHWFSNWSKGVTNEHAKRTWRYIEIYITPFIGAKPIQDITPLEVLELIQAIEQQGKRPTAQKALNAISLVFRHGVIMGLCPYNVTNELATLLESHKEKPYSHLLDPLEIGQLLLAIDGYQGNPINRAFMALLPLTLARPSEIRELTWDEVNIKDQTITKDSTKNSFPHIIPLSRQAVAIIDSMRAFNGHNVYIFDIGNKKTPMSETAPHKAIKQLSNGRASLHGWRHTASTLLNEQGYNHDWIERQLAHKDPNAIRGAYNHAQYLDQRREMLQAWADYLDELKERARSDL